jgi:pyruvate/2-oxoglutarate dehydrogenase complex dihydrolipoamide acyltransferase (E2) component
MSANIESIRKKVAALLKQNEEAGATENEANNAFQMAQRLMQEHGITLEEIKNTPSKNTDFSEKKIKEGRNNLHEVDLYGIANAIAKFTDTTVYKTKKVNEDATIVFFGYNPDVELAEYIREVCKRAMETEWKMFSSTADLVGHKRRHRKNFMIGMSQRIVKRLADMKSDHIQSNGTELVVLKNQMVVQALNEHNVRIRKASARKVYYDKNSSYNAGQAAGNNVQFNKKVKDGASGGQTMITG